MSSVPGSSQRPKTTVLTLQEKRDANSPITMVTAYDFPSARAADQAGVDAILVGDSLAMVVLGYDSTLPVTMDEMLHHAKAVRRGASRALLIGDLPFMSYQADRTEAIRNAGRFLKEAGMDAVKLEGGKRVVETVRGMVECGIPVQGHIGLTPQSLRAMGGYKVQGRDHRAAQTLLEDALALESAGCFSLVLEGVPQRLARHITEQLTIPTIGIGAGASTSGQVLVFHDLLGIEDRFQPKFLKRYAHLSQDIQQALTTFCNEVEAGEFPAAEHTYSMDDEQWRAFLDAVEHDPGPAPLKVAEG